MVYNQIIQRFKGLLSLTLSQQTRDMTQCRFNPLPAGAAYIPIVIFYINYLILNVTSTSEI